MQHRPGLRRRGDEGRQRPLRVMFLNTRDSLGADVAVHLLLARSLDRSQVQVWAATNVNEAPGMSTRAVFASIPDLTLLPLDLGRPVSDHSGAGRLWALLGNIGGAANLARLATLCRREHIDIIHVTERPRDMLFGLLLARLAGCACLIHAHTSYYRHNATTLSDLILRQADAVVGVSHFTTHTFVEQGRLPADRTFAVHNAVDPTFFVPDLPLAMRTSFRERFGVRAHEPLIGCVARLSRWKDQMTLLEALVIVRQTIPDARVVLAGVNADSSPDGSGSYEEYLHRRITALGLRDAVTFAGFVPQDQMPGFYAALDVLAHPSVEEPFGLALVEAMASARPVVAINAGGVPEIIRSGVDGVLIASRQPESMAEALITILSDPQYAQRLAEAARDRVCESFTPERQAATLTAVYRQVSATRSRRHYGRTRGSGS